MGKLIAFLTLKCSHPATTWPRKRGSKTVVVCTACGCEIPYSWTEMKRLAN